MKRQHPTDPNLFWCPKCRTYKERHEFHKAARGIYGVKAYCKECVKSPRPPRKMICTVCGSEFHTKGWGNAKFCGRGCELKSRIINRIAARDVHCIICGIEIRDGRSDRKWCDGCRKEKERVRSRDKQAKIRSTTDGRKRSSEISKRSKGKHIERVRAYARINVKQWKKENPEKAKKLRKDYKKRIVREMRETYLVGALRRAEIPVNKETVELKKQQLKDQRKLKQLKEEKRNGANTKGN